jgi:hypothetical protein
VNALYPECGTWENLHDFIFLDALMHDDGSQSALRHGPHSRNKQPCVYLSGKVSDSN